ncbi:hypothetical protein B0J17DRAFT_653250 [Rhizoctonia solani]|nr:hypothetical protein B0J17DRAFT_653250 [Rhizoctonia solani]
MLLLLLLLLLLSLYCSRLLLSSSFFAACSAALSFSFWTKPFFSGFPSCSFDGPATALPPELDGGGLDGGLNNSGCSRWNCSSSKGCTHIERGGLVVVSTCHIRKGLLNR